ncbi:type IV toxin-antitoxin system AbiEi family antitoxin domain-containing protein [Actinotalea sp. AC32]|nr:type IV toxin-antitoxin system AbiEi family antitoxin domain-containing protein [Actinotalea sp. AC32]
MDVPEALVPIARRQGGAVHVRQAAAAGVAPDLVERRARAGRWQRLHRGVYVVHSGPLTPSTWAHAGVLYAGPGSALTHASAGWLHGFARCPEVVEVAIPHTRQVMSTATVRVRRRRDLPVQHGDIAVVEGAVTVLDLVARSASTDEAVAVITSAVRAHIGPDDVLRALDARPRRVKGDLVRALLDAAVDGTESALEHRYRRDVEERHGLPRSQRQRWAVLGGRWTRGDVLYVEEGVRVELDGELAHPGGRTDADTWRDNSALLRRAELTLRYRWSHVAGTPCATAAQVASALTARGWRGALRRCGPECAARGE